MTIKVLRTSIKEISKLKVLCKCGYAVEMPVKTFEGIDSACPLCAKRLPLFGLYEFNKALFNLLDGLNKMEDVDVVIETEEK